jgi:hypothetical protein
MRLAILLAVAMLAGPVASVAQDPAVVIVPGTSLGIVPRGGAAGGDAVYCNGCDFIGPRNMEGGGPDGTNFDIGAGSTQNPGDLVLNYDVGRNTLIFDGRKHLVARFGPHGIVFYTRPKLKVHR